MTQPGVEELDEVVDALRRMQADGGSVPLHPGDLGWARRFGAATLAANLRIWRHDGVIVAVGMLDGPTLIRLAVASADRELAERLAADVSDPARGVLPAGAVAVEARFGGPFNDLLRAAGWVEDEPWTPLRYDLAAPVADTGLRVELVGADRAHVWAGVQRTAFPNSSLAGDGWRQRWDAMSGGAAFAEARFLVAHDDANTPVAVAAVWSAGAGRPGLLEPVGADPEHRGHGYGRAVCIAAAAVLRELGSSSAVVCTPSANTGGVAAYVSAGYEQLPDVRDLRRVG